MNITDFTSYAEVRQAVGLSIKELTDVDLSAEMYANSLQIYLAKVTLPDEAPGPGPLETRFAEIVLITEGTRTAKEQELYNLTRLYATYAVAHEAAMSLSTRTPKTISDGKHTLVRFSPESVYQTTLENIKKRLEDLKLQLETIAVSSTYLIPALTAIKPAVNVVTNE